eukprot:52712-Pyramimonas_sp.AAC.1
MRHVHDVVALIVDVHQSLAMRRRVRHRLVDVVVHRHGALRKRWHRHGDSWRAHCTTIRKQRAAAPLLEPTLGYGRIPIHMG